MKFSVSSVAALCMLSSAAAFTMPSSGWQKSMSMAAATLDKSEAASSEEKVEDSGDIDDKRAKFQELMKDEAAKKEAAPQALKAVEVNSNNGIQPGRYGEDAASVALPFLKRPSKLDGSHAGDFGFDPLGLTEELDLYTLQESELRHARLAMLAVIGWPMSELIAPDWMLQNGMAPSVLNGFNPASFLATALFFGAAGFFEYKTALRRTYDTEFGKKHREDMANVWDLGVAGDYGFDPLGLYSSIGDDAIARKGLREVEISHGRSAMLGITGFAMWEWLTGHPIVENSMFFHPNLLLPALVAAGVAAGQVYEFEESDKYPLRLKVSSEGQSRLENFNMGMSSFSGNAKKAAKDANMEDKMEKTMDFISTLKEKYNSMNEGYTTDVMKNIK